jgi:glycosyltransferase involved in cell wall biosynthesis
MISLTVPVFNEREALGPLFEKVQATMRQHFPKNWEIIFVNDGSLDGSAELLDGLAEKNPQVKVVHFRRNFGQTAAMMAGFDFASGDITIPLDGDGQNDPQDIPRIVAKLDEGFEVFDGCRWCCA